MGISRTCPFCREAIHPEAIKCRHCGEFLTARPAEARDASQSDGEHLRLLSIFHYVLAGVKALVALFPVIHLLVGIFMVAAAAGSGGRNAPPVFLGAFFIVMALVGITLGLAYAFCLFRAGQYLSRRQNHRFCQIVAGISCIFVPFGTALGVFTLVTLMKPSVKALFDRSPS